MSKLRGEILFRPSVSQYEALASLRLQVTAFGSQRAFAKAHGLDHRRVGELLKGKRTFKYDEYAHAVGVNISFIPLGEGTIKISRSCDLPMIEVPDSIEEYSPEIGYSLFL